MRSGDRLSRTRVVRPRDRPRAGTRSRPSGTFGGLRLDTVVIDLLSPEGRRHEDRAVTRTGRGLLRADLATAPPLGLLDRDVAGRGRRVRLAAAPVELLAAGDAAEVERHQGDQRAG